MDEVRFGVFLNTACLLLQDLGGAERQTWNEKAAEGINAYKKELEEYNKVVAMASKTTTPEHES